MDRKALCCLCLNDFDLEDLMAMPDGGSGGCCSTCYPKL